MIVEDDEDRVRIHRIDLDGLPESRRQPRAGQLAPGPAGIVAPPRRTHVLRPVDDIRMIQTAGDSMRMLLGLTPEHGTVDVIDRLYHWPSIIHQPARVQVA